MPYTGDGLTDCDCKDCLCTVGFFPCLRCLYTLKTPLATRASLLPQRSAASPPAPVVRRPHSQAHYLRPQMSPAHGTESPATGECNAPTLSFIHFGARPRAFFTPARVRRPLASSCAFSRWIARRLSALRLGAHVDPMLRPEIDAKSRFLSIRHRATAVKEKERGVNRTAQ